MLSRHARSAMPVLRQLARAATCAASRDLQTAASSTSIAMLLASISPGPASLHSFLMSSLAPAAYAISKGLSSKSFSSSSSSGGSYYSKAELSQQLKTSDLAHLLHDAGIDFRDCLERSELLDRLVSSMSQLPPGVTHRLHALMKPGSTSSHHDSTHSAQQANSSGSSDNSRTDSTSSNTPESSVNTSSTADAAAEAAAAHSGGDAGVTAAATAAMGLYGDEQYVVSLFQR